MSAVTSKAASRRSPMSASRCPATAAATPSMRPSPATATGATARRTEPGRHLLKVATYNVNGVNGRLDALLDWLGKTEPDVVCLQELKAPDAAFPAEAMRRAGYGAIW